MNWRTWLRLVELFITVLICTLIVFIYFHYLFTIPYSRVVGLALVWLIYQIVKFISIRNKKLFIKTY